MGCDDTIFRGNLVAIIFGLVAIAATAAIWWWHHSDKEPDVDLTDLLMENGRLSRLAVTWLGSFMVMTFGFVYLLLTKALTDTYALLYAGTWAAPIITKLFAVKPEIQSKPVTPEEVP